MSYRIGIDAGSKTIKAVVVDEDGKIVESVYRRHRLDIRSTAIEVVHELLWRCGNVGGPVGITGSAGIGLAQILDLPFIQEVMAVTRAVKGVCPDADAVIELGGEDAKVMFLSGGLEQRMNATCAGGTGGFIDTIAFMIGVQPKDMSNLSLRAKTIYPIASRCAVFAQTDIRPLINSGVSTADLAGSALEAVVRQTIGGLACGRPVKGKVVFLGGPFEHIPDLVRRFRNALKLDRRTGVKPKAAHLFAALGAALSCSESADEGGLSLADLEERLKGASEPPDDLERLDPLFSSREELEEFKDRHRETSLPKLRFYDARGPLFVGIDSGSTYIKLAVVNEAGHLVYSDISPVRGDTLLAAAGLLERLYSNMPRTYNGDPLAYIAHVTATGYGEKLLMAAYGIDSGVVETVAHVTAALNLDPELTFLLDIGGQDIKAIWVRDGQVERAVLNEACSSGCGSFVEGIAYSLRSNPAKFSDQALCSRAPVDLGTKCTVFMTSRIRHAQKIGVPIEDLAAGAAYSVVRNALFRIVGIENINTLGSHMVVQGGAFASDAILRAFEKTVGGSVSRPSNPQLMGAIGAALVARDRAFLADGRSTVDEVGCSADKLEASKLISLEGLEKLDVKRFEGRCSGCSNSCKVSIVWFGGGSFCVSGNRCSKAESLVAAKVIERVPENDSPHAGLVLGELEENGGTCASKDLDSSSSAPNAVSVEQSFLLRYSSCEGRGLRRRVKIGILSALDLFNQIPFWHTLFNELGFSVVVPVDACSEGGDLACDGVGAIASESICYPAKIAHRRLARLVGLGSDVIFAPRYLRGSKCPVRSWYPDALADAPDAFFDSNAVFLSPVFAKIDVAHFADDQIDSDILFSEINRVCPSDAPLGRVEYQVALAASLAAQRDFESAVLYANQRAVEWAREAGHRGIVFAGRPYHSDPALMHSIDKLVVDLGYSVIAAGRFCDPDEEMENPFCGEKRPGAKIVRLIMDNPFLDLVWLESFNCGYGSLDGLDATGLMKEAGKPFTLIRIDDIVDLAHIRIRLRTLSEAIPQTAKRSSSTQRVVRRSLEKGACDFRPLDSSVVEMARAGNVKAFSHFERSDVDVARMYAPDICYVSAALLGRALRIVFADPDIEKLMIPEVCLNCLNMGIGRLIEQACGKSPEIIWRRFGDVGFLLGGGAKDCECRLVNQRFRRQSTVEAEGGRCASKWFSVGLIGAAPLVFDDFLNDDVIGFVMSQGFEVALPDPKNLHVEDVRYLEQMDLFYEAGVKHVIYLLSFGCLKGHICARGALRSLARRYPGMGITVIDYDLESSALNRENRLRLALGGVSGSAV